MRPRHLVPLATGLVLTLGVPAAVAAHVGLVSTTPADGTNVTEPPSEVVITFDGELDPEVSGFTVTDSAGAEVGTGIVDLEVADRDELRGDVEITEPGVYLVSWTAAGTDGHEETGEFRFGYRTDVEAGAGAVEQPNTAVAEPGTAAATLLAGVAAIVAAAVAALRLMRAALRRPGRTTAP